MVGLVVAVGLALPVRPDEGPGATASIGGGISGSSSAEAALVAFSIRRSVATT